MRESIDGFPQVGPAMVMMAESNPLTPNLGYWISEQGNPQVDSRITVSPRSKIGNPLCNLPISSELVRERAGIISVNP